MVHFSSLNFITPINPGDTVIKIKNISGVTLFLIRDASAVLKIDGLILGISQQQGKTINLGFASKEEVMAAFIAMRAALSTISTNQNRNTSGYTGSGLEGIGGGGNGYDVKHEHAFITVNDGDYTGISALLYTPEQVVLVFVNGIEVFVGNGCNTTTFYTPSFDGLFGTNYSVTSNTSTTITMPDTSGLNVGDILIVVGNVQNDCFTIASIASNVVTVTGTIIGTTTNTYKPQTWSTTSKGDKLLWFGSYAGYQLDTSDIIVFSYGGTVSSSIGNPDITLTTLSTTGPATLTGNVLNIPVYATGVGTQTFAETLAFGNTTSGISISISNGDTIRFNVGSGGIFNSASTTAPRTWLLPDASGTLALAQPLNFVPLAGTTLGSPLTGTIDYEPLTPGQTPLVSTTQDYYIGVGNNVNLSAATLFSYTHYGYQVHSHLAYSINNSVTDVSGSSSIYLDGSNILINSTQGAPYANINISGSGSTFQNLDGVSNHTSSLNILSSSIALTSQSLGTFSSVTVFPSTVIIQSSFASFAGAQYDIDYSAYFTPLSLITKGYADATYATIISENFVPLSGTALGLPLTGTIVYSPATSATSALISTTQDFYIGTANNTNISLSTRGAYINFGSSIFPNPVITLNTTGVTGNAYIDVESGSIFSAASDTTGDNLYSYFQPTFAEYRMSNSLGYTAYWSINGAQVYQVQVSDSVGNNSSIYAGTTSLSLSVIDSSGNDFSFNITPTTALIENNYGAFSGLQYAADYSSNFVALSLITKGYADATYAPIVGGGYLPLIGTALGSPLTGTIDYEPSTNGTTLIVSTTEDFYIGTGNTTDLQSATSYSYLYFDTTSMQLNLADGSGNINNNYYGTSYLESTITDSSGNSIQSYYTTTDYYVYFYGPSGYSYIELEPQEYYVYVSDNGSNNTEFYMSTTTMNASGSGAFAGIQYGTDYSTNFTNLSLINKGYADATYVSIIAGGYVPIMVSGINIFNYIAYQINDAAGNVSIDYNNRYLYDPVDFVSLDWGNRQLNTNIGYVAVDWQNLSLSNSHGTSVDWGNYITYDQARNNSMDYNNYYLYSYGQLSVDWGDYWLFDSSNNLSVNWGNRLLIDTNGNTSIDYENYVLYDQSSNLSLNFQTRNLCDHNSNVSVDYDNKQLIKDGNAIVDWNAFTLNDVNGNPLIYWNHAHSVLVSTATDSLFRGIEYGTDYSAHFSFYSLINKGYADATYAPITSGGYVPILEGATTIFNHASYQINDSSGTLSIDYDGRFLFDALGNKIIAWNNYIANDINSFTSIDWNNRLLYYPDGATIALSWATHGFISLNDTSGTAAITISTTNRFLVDSFAFTSIDFGNRLLIDNANVNSTDWQNRLLVNSVGTTLINWAGTYLQYTDGNQGLNKILRSDTLGNATWESLGSITGVFVPSGGHSYSDQEILYSDSSGNATGNSNFKWDYTDNILLINGGQIITPIAGSSEITTGSILTTLDGSSQTIQTITTLTDSITTIQSIITYRKTAGLGVGTIGDGSSFIITTSIRNVGGIITLDTIENTYTGTINAISGADATFVVSGPSVFLIINGAINDTINWTVMTRTYTVQ